MTMTTGNYTPIDDLVKKSTKEEYLVNAGPTKEAASVSTRKRRESSTRKASREGQKELEIHEVAEHEPAKEVKGFVKHRKEAIDVPPDLKSMGVSASAPTQFTTHTSIKLPISDDKVLQGLHAPITSSLRWLAELCLYILKKAHLTLKNVRGRVRRVVKTQ